MGLEKVAANWFVTCLTGATLLGLGGLGALGSESAAAPRYKTTYKTIRSLGLDLYRALAPKQKAVVNSELIMVDTEIAPAVRLSEATEDGITTAGVTVSTGFIDLVNYVAHAKAIDSVEKGYFEKYVASLALESGETELKALPNASNPSYWTDNILQEQWSNFNQMVAAAVAIELSHYYLGHFKRCADKLGGGAQKAVPINSLLLPNEWDESLRAGVRNALGAGLGVEGPKALFEAMDKMPKRPVWTLYFMPEGVKVKAMKKEMEKIEKRFLTGEE